MPVTSYSTTAANNNSSPPNGFPEGQAANTLNDCMRQVMTDIAVEAQVNAVKVLASVAGTNTITGSLTPDLTAYSAGMMVVLTPANNCTGACTLNIDGRGALDILKGSGDPVAANDLLAGVPAFLVLDSGADDFYLLNPQSLILSNLTVGGTLTLSIGAVTAGTYSPTVTNVTNVSGSTAGTHAYLRVGNVVTVSGNVSGNTSASGTIDVAVSLPIASNFTALSDANGAGGSGSGTGIARGVAAAISADATNDRVDIVSTATAAGTYGFFYTFTYVVK